MTDDRTLERAARSWLEDGPTRAPDRAVDAALSRIQTTRQERDLRIPWRLPTMNPAIRWAGAGVLVLAVVGAAVLLMRPASSVGPARPSATPSLTADGSPPATPLATPVPTLTVSDVGRSLRAGSYMVSGFAVPFTVALPDGWAVNELTPTSVAIGSSSDGTINFFMTVVTRAYADPCRPTGSPKPGRD